MRSRIAIPLQHVLFPAFSSLQNDISRLQGAVKTSGRLLSAIVFPIGIGISSVANELVPVLYGQNWKPMIPIVIFLGISIAIRGSATLATPLFNSQNRVGLNFRLATISMGISVTLIMLASDQGLVAVAAAVCIGSFSSIVIYRVALGLIGLSSADLVSILGPSFAASGLMFITIQLSREALIPIYISSEVFALVWHISLGIMVYIFVLWAISKPTIDDLLFTLRKLLRK